MSEEQMSTTELQIRTLLGSLREYPSVPQHLIDGFAEKQQERLSTPHNLNSAVRDRQRFEALSEVCLLLGTLMAVALAEQGARAALSESRIAELEKGPL